MPLVLPRARAVPMARVPKAPRAINDGLKAGVMAPDPALVLVPAPVVPVVPAGSPAQVAWAALPLNVESPSLRSTYRN